MLCAGEQAAEEEEGGRSQGAAEPRDRKDAGPDESELDSEAELMRSMGLPLQFGSVSAHKNFEVSISLLCLFLFLSFLHKISRGIILSQI